MSVRQLRALVAVCDDHSITRVASRFFVSQPTLSRQISALEQVMGLALFERLPRSVEPTAAALALLDGARAVIAAHDDLVRVVRGVKTCVRGELRIGTLYSLSLGVLPSLLAAWRNQYPDVHAFLHEYSHKDDLAGALVAGTFDLAIGPAPDRWRGGLRHLGYEEFVVVPKAGANVGDGIDIAALSADEWVHFAPGNGLGEMLDRVCAEAGFVPRVAIRTEQARAAVEYAMQGVGHALVPANIVPSTVQAYCLQRRVLRDVSVYWRGAGNVLTNSLVERLMIDCSEALASGPD